MTNQGNQFPILPGTLVKNRTFTEDQRFFIQPDQFVNVTPTIGDNYVWHYTNGEPNQPPAPAREPIPLRARVQMNQDDEEAAVILGNLRLR